jgi:hypothetical protein
MVDGNLPPILRDAAKRPLLRMRIAPGQHATLDQLRHAANIGQMLTNLPPRDEKFRATEAKL